jgi:hypothetical protein
MVIIGTGGINAMRDLDFQRVLLGDIGEQIVPAVITELEKPLPEGNVARTYCQGCFSVSSVNDFGKQQLLLQFEPPLSEVPEDICFFVEKCPHCGIFFAGETIQAISTAELLGHLRP